MAKWTLEELLLTDPQDFETLLSGLFRNMGYRAEPTQYSRDRGVDIVISIENFGLSHTWLVQAKRYSNPVGVKEVREYSSLRYRDRVDGVIIVTTSTFTREAMQEAAEHNVRLIDGNLLVGMLNHYIPDGSTQTTDDRTNRISEEIGNGAILKSGEEVIASEVVMIGNEKFTLKITNRNLFLKKESSGLFSKNSSIEERIEIKEIIGMHTESGRVILITGSKKPKLYPLTSRKLPGIIRIFESLQSEYLKGEHLLLSSRNGTQLTILTNKRLAVTDISEGTMTEIRNKSIVGVEVKGGFLKKEQLHVLEDSDVVTKHNFDVDQPARWKEMIGQCVRTL
ncbi:restriction endonuclease [Methanolobus sp. WCC4]|uniref:restriction endonuclease n=1 Tax=Methanolobus sp. WCC4 TaxID=3125784 RepID=UPI0030F5AFEB